MNPRRQKSKRRQRREIPDICDDPDCKRCERRREDERTHDQGTVRDPLEGGEWSNVT